MAREGVQSGGFAGNMWWQLRVLLLESGRDENKWERGKSGGHDPKFSQSFNKVVVL